MPAPKATSHGLYGAAGAAALTFMSAASAGVASATAATADKINFFICCPSQLLRHPAAVLFRRTRPCPRRRATAPNNALGNVRRQNSAAIAAFLGESDRF